MKSITKPKNVIPTVVVLDPVTNQSISRIQKSPFIQDETTEENEVVEETNEEVVEEAPVVEETPVVEENLIENDTLITPIEDEPTIIVDDNESIEQPDLPSATNDDIQAIINGYDYENEDNSNNTSSDSNYEEFDDSNIPVATNDDILNIINSYRSIF